MKVNEIFPTVQGEGPGLGQPAIFLRLAGCNLRCTWCDTKYAWDWEHYNRSVEEHEWSVPSLVKELYRIQRAALPKSRRVVVTGGEPMLQQGSIVDLQRALGPDWAVDLETAGTLAFADLSFAIRMDHIVVSPKLMNSGNQPLAMRRLAVLKGLAELPNSWFKFVVANHEDADEAMTLAEGIHAQTRQIYFMPLGSSHHELQQTAPLVMDLCREFGVRYTPRAHIDAYGMRRAV